MFENCIVHHHEGIRPYEPKDLSQIEGMLLCGQGLGDVICMIPTVNNVAKKLNKKIVVWTLRPEVFKFQMNVTVRLFNDARMKDFLKEGKLLLVTPVTVKGGLERHQMHLIDHSANHLAALEPEEKEFTLASSENAEVKIKEILEPFKGRKRIVVHPNINTPIRSWLAERWEALIELLLEEYYVFVVGRNMDHVQSETEVHQKRLVKLDIEDPHFLNLMEQLSLHELYELIRVSDVVVTADSGVLHVANCTGTPVVCIFTNIEPDYRMRYRAGKVGCKNFPVFAPCPK